ncbi:MAG: DUF7873 family protein [Candidatus Sifarchaeia archaeon]|jgi:hypothetical protein
MTKLNQIVAVVNGQKSKTEKAIKEVYQKCQRGEIFNGLTRNYTPLEEDGERLPTETKRIQYNVDEAVNEFKKSLGKLFNLVAIQDYSNCEAFADVVVGDTVILNNVPVTYLMFLEKQLNDINTFVGKLPVLESGEKWEWSDNEDCFVSESVDTVRTKRKFKTLIRYEATTEHPAQTEVYNEDVPVGKWKLTKFSGSIPRTEKKNMLERVEDLRNAVKFAREEANDMEITDVKVSENILNFIFPQSSL